VLLPIIFNQTASVGKGHLLDRGKTGMKSSNSTPDRPT
jgi:hypothetical protein